VSSGHGNGEPPALRRLVSARAAHELLAPFAPLLGGMRCRLLRPDGVAHAEVAGADWSAFAHDGTAAIGDAPSAEHPLVVGGAMTGLVVVDPPPADGRERAVVDVLVAALRRALEGASAQRGLAAETLERYREIHLLYRVGEALGGTLDPSAVPRRVLREARGVIDGHGGGVWLAPEADGEAGLTVIEDDAHGVAVSGAPAPDPPAAAAAATAAASAIRARLEDPLKATILAGATLDAARSGPACVGPAGAAGAAPSVAPADHHLWAPLLARETLLGGVWLSRSATAPVFSAGDAKLLSALATQAAAFLDNARLHQRSLAQERMEHELQLAYEVQARLMPRVLPDLAGWDIAGYWRPAREVSGDFYDVLRIGDALGVVVADVADKGMPAALFMAVTRSLLRAGAVAGRTPAAVVTTVNRLASLDAADGMFVTLWYGELHPDGAVRYVNAGHNPPLLVRADGAVERLPRTGILVGWDGDAGFGESAVALGDGDLLIAFTDGVTEARDPSGQEFGESRLIEVVLGERAGAAAALVDAVRAALDAFVAGAAAHDDCTLVIARRRVPTP
jgi:serine phosphatase RsbU (regulator of sigma subunit)